MAINVRRNAQRVSELAAELGALDDPLDRLAAIHGLRRQLAELELAAVREARLRAKPWTEIGAAAGVSKQAIHRRFASIDVFGVDVALPAA